MSNPAATGAKDKSYADTVRGLRLGFGVEDIAVLYGHAVETIRAHVAQMRAAGILASLIAAWRAK